MHGMAQPRGIRHRARDEAPVEWRSYKWGSECVTIFWPEHPASRLLLQRPPAVPSLRLRESPMRSLQGKASIMGVDGDTSYGLARHVFKRFPESYLRGVFLACASEDAHDSVRGGMTWDLGRPQCRLDRFRQHEQALVTQRLSNQHEPDRHAAFNRQRQADGTAVQEVEHARIAHR